MLTLYDMPKSGNCYKIRLMLAMLKLDYARVNIDLLSNDHQSAAFRALNPRRQIPVLVDGEDVIWDSLAILVYLARRYGDESWVPREPLDEARVLQWLALASNELQYGLARARAAKIYQRPFNLEQAQSEGRSGLVTMELRLTEHEWLAANHATVADVACYPYVLMAPMGEVSLADYPHVRHWLARVETLPGWVSMEHTA